MSRCKSWVIPPFLNGRAVFAHKHALALAHASRGGKCKRRGAPPLERSDQRSGGGVAQRRSAQAKRGRLGIASCRAPGTEFPQQAWFPWLCAERMNVLGEGVAGRNGPLRRVSEDGGVIAGWRLGKHPPSTWSICFRSYSLSNAVEERNRAKMERTHQGHITRARGAPICVFWGDFDNILLTMTGVAKAWIFM
jgi:hypothetical protein